MTNSIAFTGLIKELVLLGTINFYKVSYYQRFHTLSKTEQSCACKDSMRWKFQFKGKEKIV